MARRGPVQLLRLSRIRDLQKVVGEDGVGLAWLQERSRGLLEGAGDLDRKGEVGGGLKDRLRGAVWRCGATS